MNGFSIAELRERLRALGANEQHAAHVLRRWVQARPMDAGRRNIAHWLPRPLREALPALESELSALATLRSEHAADDGARLLVELADGQTVESVLLPKGGLCVSTQVGCAVGCVFCMTGTLGLLRQLSAAEIVAQVALARRRRAVGKVVFMGMGEPAHNLDAVCEAIELLGSAGGIAHKNLVFSTVGDARVFERLPRLRVKPALALSLHSLFDERRAALLPRAPRWQPEALVDEAERYARAADYPVQLQWTLIEGVNDGDDEVERACELLARRPLMLNLIPYNSVEALPWRRPSWERAAEITRVLNRHGVYTRLRRSAAQDVEGGCGQLRARAADGSAAVRTVRVLRAPRADARPGRPR